MQPLRKYATIEEVAGLLGKFRPNLPENRATELINSPAIQQFLSVSRDLQNHEEQLAQRQQIESAIKEEAHASGAPAHVLREHVSMQRRRTEARYFDLSNDDFQSVDGDTTNVQVGERSLPIDT